MNYISVVGVGPGPREGWITVVCSDGSVWIGLDGIEWPHEDVSGGTWKEAPPIPCTLREKIFTFGGFTDDGTVLDAGDLRTSPPDDRGSGVKV